MRKLQVVSLTLILSAAGFVPGLSAADRVFKENLDIKGVETLSIESGVGDIDIIQEEELQNIRLEITLHPRRGGLFSSLREGEEQVRKAALEAKRSSNRLELSVSGGEKDRRFEENWKIRMPAGLEMEIELGVGDLEINGLSADADIEIGVGDAKIFYGSGDLDLETGVGDIAIEGLKSGIAAISAESGVGNVMMVAGKKKIKGEGMVGHSLSWSGDGQATMELESGVGDIEIRLH